MWKIRSEKIYKIKEIYERRKIYFWKFLNKIHITDDFRKT